MGTVLRARKKVDRDELRALRILLAHGFTRAEILRALKMTRMTYYRRRAELHRIEMSRVVEDD